MAVLTELERVVRLRNSVVPFQRGDIVNIQCDNFTRTLLHARFTRLFRVRLRCLEFGLVDAQPELFRHQTREVDRESIRVVQPPYVLARELFLAGLQRLLRVLLEQLLSTIECARERLLFLVKNLLDLCILLRDLREDVTLNTFC